VKENLLGFELVLVELASDRMGLAALWFQIVRSLVTTGMPAVGYEVEAPRRKYPKVGAALGVALCLSD
jgi:hypothetical protein